MTVSRENKKKLYELLVATSLIRTMEKKKCKRFRETFVE